MGLFWLFGCGFIKFEHGRFKYVNDHIDTGFKWLPTEHVVQIEFLSRKKYGNHEGGGLYVYWNYADFFLGRSIYSESMHGQSYHVKNLKLTLPEGEYHIKLDRYTGYWHRPRSPFVRSIERVEITPDRGLPIPGKGENSWDMEDDAIYSSTEPTKGRTDEQIVADLRDYVLKQRQRYGGSRDWVPVEEVR